MTQKKGLGALQFARIPARKPDELADYSGDNVPYKFRSLGDIEYRASKQPVVGDSNLRRLGLNIIEDITGGDYGKMITEKLDKTPTKTEAAGAKDLIKQLEAGLQKMKDYYNDATKEGGVGVPDSEAASFARSFNNALARIKQLKENPSDYGTVVKGKYYNEDLMKRLFPEESGLLPQITYDNTQRFSDEVLNKLVDRKDSDALRTAQDVPKSVLGHEVGHFAIDELQKLNPELESQIKRYNEDDLLGIIDQKFLKSMDMDPRVYQGPAYAQFRDTDLRSMFEDKVDLLEELARQALAERGDPPLAVPVAYRPYDDAAVRRARVGPTGVTPKEKSFMERLKGLIGMSAGGIASIRKA